MQRRTTIILALLACGMLAGCKENGTTGGQVEFTAWMGPISTRTAYSGEGINSSNQTASEATDLLAKERIDWVTQDQFTVWSDQAMDGSKHTADYVVQSLWAEDDESLFSGNLLRSRAWVAPVTGNGLQWTTRAETYHFFGRYPADENKINGTTMTGTIPYKQKLTWDSGRVKGLPDMQHAYMFTRASGGYREDVRLLFRPMFSAFQFTIGSGDNAVVYLKSFRLETTWEGTPEGTYPAGDLILTYSTSSSTETITTANGVKYIEVDLQDGNNNPLELHSGSPVTFTVLTLPVNLTGLVISFTDADNVVRTLKLNDSTGAPLSFPAGKKYRIYGLSFPSIKDAHGEYIEWDVDALGEDILWIN